MTVLKLNEILNAFKSGALTEAEAEQAINGRFFQDLGHSTLDHDRARRNGSSEVIYGEGKTPEQICELCAAMLAAGHNILISRTTEQVFRAVAEIAPAAQYHSVARMISCIQQPPEQTTSRIAIVTAGTSDLPVAEEAAVTAEHLGSQVDRIVDVGVAGIHRLLARADELRTAKVLIVVAGMEGALPSVVGGLVDKPVIAVPTSVGYGAAFSGVAALLGMLNSCASGLSVVNIDNGFGAGYLANMINRL